MWVRAEFLSSLNLKVVWLWNNRHWVEFPSLGGSQALSMMPCALLLFPASLLPGLPPGLSWLVDALFLCSFYPGLSITPAFSTLGSWTVLSPDVIFLRPGNPVPHTSANSKVSQSMNPNTYCTYCHCAGHTPCFWIPLALSPHEKEFLHHSG